jgi:hypothetical protein
MGSILKIEETFAREVEAICLKHKDASVIDAIIELCEKHGIEPDSVAKLVSKPIKERLKAEFEQRNMLKGGRKSRLPLE